MKKALSLILCALLFTGCASNTVAVVTPTETAETVSYPELTPAEAYPAPEYVSRYDTETTIALSDEDITVNGGEETEAVFTSHDITFYEDRETYDRGNPYGAGEVHERHSAEEAAAHTVVNITQPGAYRVTGTLTAGQIRVDLGIFAYEDPEAVVELILDNADITCTVAPAILFLNTYECDGKWSVETAQAEVDTTAAGANLILAGKNTVTGSHVAKIFRDAEGEKKLWKQDGAIYSYMSLNVYGSGSLDLAADNEGLDTELHLTINGGDITIRSDNDGINTNEDGVSVTTINGGSLRIAAGLGAEGDGIDSNGYLVINGGTVIASANPAADAGMDSDLGTYIHGGTVLALGSAMDQAHSASRQVALNLQFIQRQSGNITLLREDGAVLFACDTALDSFFAQVSRAYEGMILSCPYLNTGATCHLYTGSTISGDHVNGVYDPLTITDCSGGTRMQHSGNGFLPGFGNGQRHDSFGQEPPEGMEGIKPQGESGDRRPGGRESEGERPTMPEGFEGEMPAPPEGFEGEMPSIPDGFEGEMPTPPEGGNFPQGGQNMAGEASVDFVLAETVTTFSGITAESQ